MVLEYPLQLKNRKTNLEYLSYLIPRLILKLWQARQYAVEEEQKYRLLKQNQESKYDFIQILVNLHLAKVVM